MRQHTDSPVARAVGAGVVHPHDDEDVLEVGADGLGGKGVGAGLLEHQRHNVVADVALPQQLISGRGRGRGGAVVKITAMDNE